jgi:excisionase family DNA binding protein
MERLFLKPREAAEVLGVGRTLLYELLKSGQIPSCRIGKTIRIPVEALRAWAAAQTPAPQQVSPARPE